MVDSRGNQKSRILLKLNPGDSEDISMVLNQIPQQLYGLSRIFIKAYLNKQEYRIPMENIRLKAGSPPPSPAISRVADTQGIRAGISSFTRNGTVLTADVILTSDQNRTIRINSFSGYDELGRIHVTGKYSLSHKLKKDNGNRLEVFLPKDQPVKVKVEVAQVPEECAGLTCLKIDASIGNTHLPFSFLDLPSDMDRASIQNDPIPHLV